MKKYRQFLSATGLLIILNLFGSGRLLAQWTTDLTVNTPVCTYSGSGGGIAFNNVVPDGSEGVIMIWMDSRVPGNGVIYAQRLDKDGYAMWTSNGVEVCNPSPYLEDPHIAPDGAGGAYVTWVDMPGGTDKNIYAQHIRGSDGAQNWPGGLAVCTETGNQQAPWISPVSPGAAIIAWEDFRNGLNWDIYASVISSSTGVVATVDIATGTSEQRSPVITTDGSGGAFIAYHNQHSSRIYVQKVNNVGMISAFWPYGGYIIGGQNGPSRVVMAPTESGGVVLAWTQAANYPEPGWKRWVWAQSLSAAGGLNWGAGGEAKLVREGFDYGYGSCCPLGIISDGAGGAYITWPETNNLNMMKVNAAEGNPVWVSPKIINAPGMSGGSGTMVADGSGNAIVSFADSRVYNYHNYVQKIDPDGTELWNGSDDVRVSLAASDQATGFVILGGKGIIVAFRDFRHGGSVYAQSFTMDEYACSMTVDAGEDQTVLFGYPGANCASLNGTVSGGTAPYSYVWELTNRSQLGGEVFTGMNTATPNACLYSNATFKLTVTDANGCTAEDDVIVQGYDITCTTGGSLVPKVVICHKGTTLCTPITSAYAHLEHGDQLGPCTLFPPSILAQGTPFQEEASTIFSIYPNPGKGRFIVNTGEAKGNLRIMNSVGQQVKQITLNGEQQLQLRLEQPGIYYLQLQDGNQVQTKKLIVTQ